MSEAKYTPGPWVIEPAPTADRWFVKSQAGTQQAVEAWVTSSHLANARLISAAPDLLEAAKEAASWFAEQDTKHGDVPSVIWQRLLAAIDKAQPKR